MPAVEALQIVSGSERVFLARHGHLARVILSSSPPSASENSLTHFDVDAVSVPPSTHPSPAFLPVLPQLQHTLLLVRQTRGNKGI